ncbi:MAG: hypothetical protein COW04_08165 [Deltaproteobacteria bacterium CG12_big_fil_rev_8_21_14_0_65_43_10]|nr:MAG: hypothetical protein AUK23_12150 [Deltaproteobacteria bacterium CG2_30_43_15]PIQ45335.1 MAG: hypothetical protein COW04_08165 [Deltaproteobacteria bacterium CG12_big_fil_rev_8_21_14_0_65_43_10]PIU84628.1 MAG: hypothetical protein COS67_12225 [Deltaproteobacteria bacterium CG06_land_8_20_14_3_00_44_19]PIX22674.1 MAG: hypothetical protein COZ68_11455 [Deltaproteobacteria bacterium CG_4_8_14_3_um_filter_43_13]PIZ19123.1 MAG: hypothetical protein COY50_11685 [Deltaproteobacteria bacterium C
MKKEIRSLGSIKTLMNMKHRSLPKAERSNDAELYLLKNNLALAQRELSSVSKRKEIVENKIREIEERIAELESEAGITRSKSAADSHSIKTMPRGAIKVMKVNY